MTVVRDVFQLQHCVLQGQQQDFSWHSFSPRGLIVNNKQCQSNTTKNRPITQHIIDVATPAGHEGLLSEMIIIMNRD